MNNIARTYEDLDKRVVPMVEFFNENGLRTCMSCQGHNRTNMSMFWIEFHSSVIEDDIIKFQKKFLDRRDNFCSNGKFANIVYVADKEVRHRWRYMAATIEAADDDLKEWKER